MHTAAIAIATDIAAIERATVAAVAPDAAQEIAGWLIPFDAGLVRRARSAVPLSHETLLVAAGLTGPSRLG